MDINDPKYIDPDTDAEARARQFIFDWMKDTRYVPDGARTITYSRVMFGSELTEAFIDHAEAVGRRIDGGKAGEGT